MSRETLQLLMPLLSPIATLAAVLVGMSGMNARVVDVSHRIDDMRDTLRGEMAKNQSELFHLLRLEK